jgi:hypothetical protein
MHRPPGEPWQALCHRERRPAFIRKRAQPHRRGLGRPAGPSRPRHGDAGPAEVAVRLGVGAPKPTLREMRHDPAILRWPRLSLCLGLGLAMTVLAAWSIQVLGSRKGATTSYEDGEVDWPGSPPKGFPRDADRSFSSRAWGSRFRTCGRNTQKDYWQGWRVQCGWPLLCLHREHFAHASDRGFEDFEPWPSLTAPAWLPTLNQEPHDRLPTRPIPLGFAVDTVLNASLVWGLGAVWIRLRRRASVGRGRCPTCGYDLAGIGCPVCPECGASATIEAP